jgi:hypothetical protein
MRVTTAGSPSSRRRSLHDSRRCWPADVLQRTVLGGRRAEAAREAEELLRRLPAGAPQRPEVERLLSAVR